MLCRVTFQKFHLTRIKFHRIDGGVVKTSKQPLTGGHHRHVADNTSIVTNPTKLRSPLMAGPS